MFLHITLPVVCLCGCATSLFGQTSSNEIRYPIPEYSDEVYLFNAETTQLEDLEIVKANVMARGGYGIGTVSLRVDGAYSNVVCAPTQQFIVKLTETNKRPEYLVILYPLEVREHPTRESKNYRFVKIARQRMYQVRSGLEQGIALSFTKIDDEGTVLVTPSEPLPAGEYVFSIETQSSPDEYGAAFQVQ